MNNSNTVISHKLPPFMSAAAFLLPGMFHSHLENYKQYANQKGADALWLSETLDVSLISAFTEDHGIDVPVKVPQKAATDDEPAETDAAYCARRQVATDELARAAYALIAPRGSKDAASFIKRLCKFTYSAGVPIKVQVSMMKASFKSHIAQLRPENSGADELIRLFLGSFSHAMVQSLKLRAKAEGWTEWTQYANEVLAYATKIEEGDHLRSLFGMPSFVDKPQKTPTVKTPTEKAPVKDAEVKGGGRGRGDGKKGGGRGGGGRGRGDNATHPPGWRTNIICDECGEAGHIRPECPYRSKPGASQSTSQKPPGSHSSSGRPGSAEPRAFTREEPRRSPRFVPGGAGKMASLVTRLVEVAEEPAQSSELSELIARMSELVVDE